MSTIKSLSSLVLALGLSSFAIACTSSDAAPAPQSPAVAQPSSTTDAKAVCIEMMTKNRTCTDTFIPALVDARAKHDTPAGIADEVKADRDAVIAKAKEEWKTDSTDEAIAQMCGQLAPSASADEVAEVRACVAKTDCGEYTACVMPATEKRFAK